MYTQSEPEEFARLLRRGRRAAGLTQEALAERAGVAWRTVSDLERGVKLPRRDTLDLLARALGLAGERRAAFVAAARRPPAGADAAVGPDVAPPAWPPSAGQAAPLVGRAQELARIARHLAGEGPPLLLLAGQPGIGKSRLLQEAAGRARAGGWCVLEGGCTRAGGQQPFAPLLEALERHLGGRPREQVRAALEGCAWLLRLLPELPEDPGGLMPGWTLPPDQERRLMFKAARRLLANVAGPAGTLLALDDLQWAGADALELLASLLQQAPGAPLRVVGAYRDTEVGPEHPLSATIAELAEAQLAAQRPVHPLGQQEAEELLMHLLGSRERVGAAPAAQVLQRAGGVPFFLVSYASGLEGDDGGEPSGQGVPWDLRQSIRRRVTALPEAGRELLAVAATAGRVVPRRLLLALLEESERTLLGALEGACRAGLLQEVGEDSYGFVHDVIREVVEGELGLARRRALHRQVAMALEGQPGKAPVEALAYHFRQGGERERAVVYLEQAGDLAAAQFAYEAAAAHYHDLVACLEELGRAADLARAREKQASALHRMARYDAVLAVLEPAAEALRAAGDLEGLGRIEAQIAAVHFDTGAIATGLSRLRSIVASLEAGGPSPSLARVYEVMAALFSHNGQPDQALLAGERAAAVARTVGDRRIVAGMEIGRGFYLLHANRADEAVRVGEDAVRAAEEVGDPGTIWTAAPALPAGGRVRAAEEVGDPGTIAWALSFLAWIYEERGEYEQDRRCAERALALAEQVRLAGLGISTMMRLGVSAFFTGDWPRARIWFERAMAFTDQVGLTLGQDYAVPRLELGRLRLAEGAWEEGSRYLEASLAPYAESSNVTMRRVAQGQLAERDVLAGNPSAACARLIPELDRPGLEERMVTQYILPVLAWAQVESGEMQQAERTVAEAVRRGHTGHCRLGLVQALRVQALVLLARERWAEAVRALDEGLAVARGMPYPHGEGRLLHVYGLLHARKGEPARAREQLDAALAIFTRLGARTDVERVERDRAHACRE